MKNVIALYTVDKMCRHSVRYKRTNFDDDEDAAPHTIYMPNGMWRNAKLPKVIRATFENASE